MNCFKLSQYSAVALFLLGAPLAFAGAVLPSSGNCPSYSSFTVDSSGSLSIACTGGGNVTTPTCSLSPSNQIIAVGGSGSLSASCANPSNAPTWINAAGGPAFSGSGGTQSFPNAGSFSYSINNGLGSASASATIVVQAATPQPIGNCPTGLKIVDRSIAWGDGMSHQPEVTTGVGHVISFVTGAATNSIGNLGMGEFTGYASERTVVISKERCQFDIFKATVGAVGVKPSIFFTVGNPKEGYQHLEANTQYYMMVKSENYQNPGVDTCPVGARCDFTFSIRP